MPGRDHEAAYRLRCLIHSKLTIGVVAPALSSSRRGDCTGMVYPSREANNARSQSRYGSGSQSCCGGAIPDLPCIIRAPALNSARRS